MAEADTPVLCWCVGEWLIWCGIPDQPRNTYFVSAFLACGPRLIGLILCFHNASISSSVQTNEPPYCCAGLSSGCLYRCTIMAFSLILMRRATSAVEIVFVSIAYPVYL